MGLELRESSMLAITPLIRLASSSSSPINVSVVLWLTCSTRVVSNYTTDAFIVDVNIATFLKYCYHLMIVYEVMKLISISLLLNFELYLNKSSAYIFSSVIANVLASSSSSPINVSVVLWLTCSTRVVQAP
jgi:hypothetical protein